MQSRSLIAIGLVAIASWFIGSGISYADAIGTPIYLLFGTALLLIAWSAKKLPPDPWTIRFSLRTLLIATTLIAVLLALAVTMLRGS